MAVDGFINYFAISGLEIIQALEPALRERRAWLAEHADVGPSVEGAFGHRAVDSRDSVEGFGGAAAAFFPIRPQRAYICARWFRISSDRACLHEGSGTRDEMLLHGNHDVEDGLGRERESDAPAAHRKALGEAHECDRSLAHPRKRCDG